MDKVTQHYADINTRAVVLYAKPADGNHIYTDKECTNKIDKDTLFELCSKNLVTVGLITNSSVSTYAKPVGFMKTTATAVSFVSGYNNSVTMMVLYSKEYTAD